MENFQKDVLGNIVLAPYLQAATALIGKSRRVGGNQFRHTWATVGILIDHKIIDSVILKAAVLHDLKEDAEEEYFPEAIKNFDSDGYRVVELIEELSINPEFETKAEYLQRVMINGSPEAKIIKLADRISNLTDIQLGTFSIEKVCRTIDETKMYILPYAKDINANMAHEIEDLVNSREQYLERTIKFIVTKAIDVLIEHTSHVLEEVNTEATNLLSRSMQDIQNIIHSNTEEDRKKIQANISDEIMRFNNVVTDIVTGITSDLQTELISQKINPNANTQNNI